MFGTEEIVKFTLSERNIYGSSRVGMNINEVEMISYVSNDPHIYNYIGKRQYELSNHLGNVLTVVSDRKFARDIDQNGEVDYFEPDILLTYDYSPFGVILKERSFEKDVCRDTLYTNSFIDLNDEFACGGVAGWTPMGGANNTVMIPSNTQHLRVAIGSNSSGSTATYT